MQPNFCSVLPFFYSTLAIRGSKNIYLFSSSLNAIPINIETIAIRNDDI